VFHQPALLTAAGFRLQSDPAGEVDNVIGFRVASVVPEPGTALLLMTGLLGLGLRAPRQAVNGRATRVARGGVGK
jgi:hypothetical protein